MQDMGLFQTLPTLRSIGLAILVGLFGMSVFSTPVQAFQDEAADETTEPVEDGADAGADADEGGADGDDGDGDDGEAAEQRNFLTWMIEASGTFGLLILLLSFIMVALIMMNILQVRWDNFVPQAFVE